MNSKQAVKIWSRVLAEACDGKTAAEQKKTVARLAEILKAKKKGYLLAEIVKNAFAALEDKNRLEITLAHPQSDELVRSLGKKIAAKFRDGRDTAVAVNPAIIGGFTAKSSQYLLDASVKSRLEKLKKTFEK